MKVLILADPAATHTIKWVNSLKERGLDVFLFGLSTYDGSQYSRDIEIRSLNIPAHIRDNYDGAYSKIIYLKAIRHIRKTIREFEPDILHSHYASSFGLLGALTKFHPYIISLWGSDIYSFPSSFIRRNILKYALSRADRILSTSTAMKEESKKFTRKEILLTPFGVDTDKFRPRKVDSLFDSSDLVIGTVKTMRKIYGIEYLIRAFHILKQKYPSMSLKLLLVGGGDQSNSLKNLVSKLQLDQQTVFTGFINPDEVADYYNMLDIYVAPSVKESFGVAVLEASACGKPVVVTNVGGLPEVVDDNGTGFIVKKENPELLADAIEKMIVNPELKFNFGENGRKKVLNEYQWIDSVEMMINIYDNLIKS